MYEDQAISNEEATKKFRKFQQLVDIFSLCRFSKYCEKAKKNDELSLCQNYWQISGFGEKTSMSSYPSKETLSEDLYWF